MQSEQENSVTSLDERVDAYLTAFNRMDLGEVLTYFSPDAVYEPGDGTSFRGREELRRAFAPQFAYAYGTISFDEEDRIVDYQDRKVMLSWTCKIDISTARFVSFSTWLQVTLGRLKFGTKGSWRGLDLLYFDRDGTITRKLTYATYTCVKMVRGWS